MPVALPHELALEEKALPAGSGLCACRAEFDDDRSVRTSTGHRQPEIVHVSLAFLGARMTLATEGVSADETIWAWLLKRQACRNLLACPIATTDLRLLRRIGFACAGSLGLTGARGGSAGGLAVGVDEHELCSNGRTPTVQSGRRPARTTTSSFGTSWSRPCSAATSAQAPTTSTPTASSGLPQPWAPIDVRPWRWPGPDHRLWVRD